MPVDETELVASYGRVEKPLYNVLYRMLWSAEDCHDLIHDAYLRIWRQRANTDASRIDALVYATAMNLARNRLRWRALRPWREVDDASLADRSSAADPERSMATAELHAALKRLPVPALQIVLLSEFSGMSVREIAVVLGIPEGTVGSRKNAAVRRLRRWLGEDDER